jgi:uncharacterized protein YecE (DUF72 family)
MPIQRVQLYMFRFNLPDGVHIAGHRDIPIRKGNAEDLAGVHQRIKQWASQNDDAVVDFDSLTPVDDYTVIAEAAKRLKEENPERPLANEMGLDTPNRVMTDPSIARAHAPVQDA